MLQRAKRAADAAESLAKRRTMADALLMPLLSGEYCDEESRLSTLPLDVVRYLLQPMLHNALFLHTGRPLVVGGAMCVRRRRQYSVEANNCTPFRVMPRPNNDLILYYAYEQVAIVVNSDDERLNSLFIAHRPPSWCACITHANQLAVLHRVSDNQSPFISVHSMDAQYQLACYTVDHPAERNISCFTSKMVTDRCGRFYVHDGFANVATVFAPSGEYLRDVPLEDQSLGSAKDMAMCGDYLVMAHRNLKLSSRTLDGALVASTTCDAALVGGPVKYLEAIAGCAGDDVVVTTRGKDAAGKTHRYVVVLTARTMQLRAVMRCDELDGPVCIDQRGHIIAVARNNTLLEIY